MTIQMTVKLKIIKLHVKILKNSIDSQVKCLHQFLKSLGFFLTESMTWLIPQMKKQMYKNMNKTYVLKVEYSVNLFWVWILISRVKKKKSKAIKIKTKKKLKKKFWKRIYLILNRFLEIKKKWIIWLIMIKKSYLWHQIFLLKPKKL